jgi:transglutaminase-like putative cysteine protease
MLREPRAAHNAASGGEPMLRCLAPILLALLLSGPARGFDAWSESARYELEYRAELTALAAPGGKVRAWLPLPADAAHQTVVSSRVEAPGSHRETRDAHGNRLLYLEAEGGVPLAPAVVRAVVERRPARRVPPAQARPETPLDPRRWLAPQRRVPLDGVIAGIAAAESRGVTSDWAKIQRFYDYVYRTMRYGKEGKGWGHGDAVWACTARYGNCTDFHSLFMGMARSQGIPTRFVIGFPIPADRAEGEIPGYHCWAEVFEPSRGWVPLDASEAWKSRRKEDYLGALPSDRVEFTVGRDLVLEPPQAGEPVNYFVYPYAEVDATPVERVPWSLRFRRLEPGAVTGGG